MKPFLLPNASNPFKNDLYNIFLKRIMFYITQNIFQLMPFRIQSHLTVLNSSNLNSNQICFRIKQIIFHSQKELENIYIPNDYNTKGNKQYLFSSIITSFITNQNQFLMMYSIQLIIITIIQFILDYCCLSSIISFGITICISIITILFEILLFSIDDNSHFLFVGSCILFQIFICLS